MERGFCFYRAAIRKPELLLQNPSFWFSKKQMIILFLWQIFKEAMSGHAQCATQGVLPLTLAQDPETKGG